MKPGFLRISNFMLANGAVKNSRISPISIRYCQTQAQEKSNDLNEEFQKLDLYKVKDRRGPRKKREKKEVLPPRFRKMDENQDWPSVWPTARTFHPAVVPLPLHQGLVPPNKAIPDKYGNLELMKIPNFLHLTPPAILRHCEALKKFCTEWPKELRTEEAIEENFPIEITSSDYCHSIPSIRDARARIVTLKIKLSILKLDDHARDKLLRLMKDRYDEKNGIITLTTDCCPTREQNYEYAMYLLTASYHESWSTEPWESEKGEDDMEKYIWDGSISERNLLDIFKKSQEKSKTAPLFGHEKSIEMPLSSDNFNKFNLVENYKNAIEKIHNIGETKDDIHEYGKAVRSMLNLPPPL